MRPEFSAAAASAAAAAPAVAGGSHGPPLAFIGERILVLAADIHLRGDVFGCLTETDDWIHGIQSGIVIAPADRGVEHLRLPREGRVRLADDEGRAGHALDAPGDDAVAHTGHDLLGGLGILIRFTGPGHFTDAVGIICDRTKRIHGDVISRQG